MSTTFDFIKNLIRHPEKTVDVLEGKPRLLFIALFLINAPIIGLLYMMCHFKVNLAVPIFWIFGVILGFIVLALPILVFLAAYYAGAKLLKEKDTGSSLKLVAFYYILALSIYHLIIVPILIVLLASSNYYLAFWIIALCAQGVYLLRKDSELRTLLKVLTSYFTSYAIGTLFYLYGSSIIVNLIIR
jgi:hypothetical protein